MRKISGYLRPSTPGEKDKEREGGKEKKKKAVTVKVCKTPYGLKVNRTHRQRRKQHSSSGFLIIQYVFVVRFGDVMWSQVSHNAIELYAMKKIHLACPHLRSSFLLFNNVTATV